MTCFLPQYLPWQWMARWVATNHSKEYFPTILVLTAINHNSHASKYFNGKLSDGQKTMWMVSFQPQQRSRFQESLDAVASVAVTDCQVKEDGFHGKLKMLQQANPSLNHHQRKFKLPNALVVLIMTHWAKYDCTCKMMVVGSSRVKDRWLELSKQECVMGDDSNCQRCFWSHSKRKIYVCTTMSFYCSPLSHFTVKRDTYCGLCQVCMWGYNLLDIMKWSRWRSASKVQWLSNGSGNSLAQ